MASDRLARLQLSFSVYLVGYDVNISASALLNTNPGLELSLDTRAGARLLLTDLTMLYSSLQEGVWTRFQVELQMKVREDFTITEKDPTRALSWLKAPKRAFTFKTLLRHDAKQATLMTKLLVAHGKGRCQ